MLYRTSKAFSFGLCNEMLAAYTNEISCSIRRNVRWTHYHKYLGFVLFMVKVINRINSRQIRGSEFSGTLLDFCTYSDSRVIVPVDFAMKYVSVRILWIPRHD